MAPPHISDDIFSDEALYVMFMDPAYLRVEGKTVDVLHGASDYWKTLCRKLQVLCVLGEIYHTMMSSRHNWLKWMKTDCWKCQLHWKEEERGKNCFVNKTKLDNDCEDRDWSSPLKTLWLCACLQESAGSIMECIRWFCLYRFTIQVPCGFPEQRVCDSIWTRSYAWCLWGTVQFYYLNKGGWSRFVYTYQINRM